MYEHLTIRSLLFEVTDYCNLKCAHCFNQETNAKQHIDVNQMYDVIARTLPYGLQRVSFSGGEPLMHPDIQKIVNLCDGFPNINFRLITNGLLFDGDIITLLEEKENLDVQMSIDGAQIETYESLRGKESYSRFVDAFELFRRSSIKKKFSRMCITSQNYRDVENVYRLCMDNNISPTFISIFKMGNASKNWKQLELSLAQKLIVVDRINRLNREYGVNIAPLLPSRVCSFTEGKERHSLTIKSDGDAVACQHFYDLHIGNVFYDSYKEIFTNANFLELYNIAQKRKVELSNSDICKSCALFSNCRWGCVGKGMKNINGLWLDDECEYRVALTVCFKNGLITCPIETEQHDPNKLF